LSRIETTDVPPFLYTKKTTLETLLLTTNGDLLITTILREEDKQESKPCRLLIRSHSPHKLELGIITTQLHSELLRLSTLNESIPQQQQQTTQLQQQRTSSSTLFIQDYTSHSPGLLSSHGIVKSYSIYKLPNRLKKIYIRTSLIIEEIKSRIPKLVLYMSVTSAHLIKQRFQQSSSTIDKSTTSSSKTKIECKCMLMSNTPLPDFCIQWHDGTKLRYSLSTGKLNLSGPTISPYKWSASNASSSLDWADIAHGKQVMYLLVAQEAMRRCLVESKKYSVNSSGGLLHRSSIESEDSLGDNGSSTLKCNVKKGPIIIVDAPHA
jgi:hypothetical protein